MNSVSSKLLKTAVGVALTAGLAVPAVAAPVFGINPLALPAGTTAPFGAEGFFQADTITGTASEQVIITGPSGPGQTFQSNGYHAWHDAARGAWPPHFPDDAKRAYTIGEIRKWLGVFLYRFFEISQYKRSALPNGPKVVSGGNLSPRGDWRAPSDGNARVWMDELEANVPE